MVARVTNLESMMDDEKRDGGLSALTDVLGLLADCRSSVKYDLLHYEKMARAYGNIGPEGAQKHEMAEAEARRLHDLLEKIDALAMS